MKEIPLTKGKFAMVDDEDYEWLMQWKWQCRCQTMDQYSEYATRTSRPSSLEPDVVEKSVFMHREIVRARPSTEVDHWDGNGLNNQKSNLRLATHTQNGCNRPRPKTSATIVSKYRGVHWSNGKWTAMIQVNGKKVYLGRFDNEKDAAMSYDEASRKHHGIFGRRNFPLQGELPNNSQSNPIE